MSATRVEKKKEQVILLKDHFLIKSKRKSKSFKVALTPNYLELKSLEIGKKNTYRLFRQNVIICKSNHAESKERKDFLFEIVYLKPKKLQRKRSLESTKHLMIRVE